MNVVRTHTPDPAAGTPATPGTPPPPNGTAPDSAAASRPAAGGISPGGTLPGSGAPEGPSDRTGLDGTAPVAPGPGNAAPANPGLGGRDSRGLSRAAEGLRWLLQGFVDEVPGVHSVAVVSSDGLLLLGSRPEPDACPARPGEARMDLAAVVSGLASLTVGAAKLMDGGRVRQTTVAMDDGMLLVTSISDGSLLGVHAAADCDVSVAGYHMARFVARAGHVLTPALRGELRHATAAGAATVDGDR